MDYSFIIEAYPDGSFYLKVLNRYGEDVASTSCHSYDDMLQEMRGYFQRREVLSNQRPSVVR